MNVGDMVQLKHGHPYEYKVGVIIDRSIEALPPGGRNDKVLVYKVLTEGIIINVPLKWLVQITDTHHPQEN